MITARLEFFLNSYLVFHKVSHSSSLGKLDCVLFYVNDFYYIQCPRGVKLTPRSVYTNIVAKVILSLGIKKTESKYRQDGKCSTLLNLGYILLLGT